MLNESDLKAALPDLSTPHRFRELRSGATIRRDRWGIPHIKADDEYDLFFAQGFATAQDRLFQMDFDRLRCLGRAAEYLGASALSQDRYMRRRRMERVAKLDYETASEAVKNALDAYADGVNAFMASTRALPVEYKLLGVRPEPWEPWHCVAVYKVRNTAEGTYQGKLWLARLAAEIGPERAALLSPGCQPGSLMTLQPGDRYTGEILNAVDELRAVIEASSMLTETDGGSNGWAISGDRTHSGLPLIAGDSHRGLDAPNVYYQVHLIGGDFAVIGFSIPGFPLALHFCHNDHIGWGMTYGSVDAQDLFVEKFRRADGRIEYFYNGEWLQARSTIETITVRNGFAAQVEIVETRHGMVIAGEPRNGVGLAIADPGSREGTPWIDAAYRAMKAKSADEFEAALDGWTDRVNNYVYADIHGSYGYALKGRIPLRGSSNGWGPVAGWTANHEWQGYIPTAELPRLRNPSAGWVVSCNQRVVDQTYPYYLSNFCSTAYRAERISRGLGNLANKSGERRGKATVKDMSSVHADVCSVPAQAMQKALMRAAGLSGVAAAAAEVLLKWDCVLATESAAAALYEITAAKLTDRLVRNHYGKLADDFLKALDTGAEEHWRRQLKPAIVVALERGDQSMAPPGESWDSLLCAALESAVVELEGRFGADRSKWRWGDLHRTRHQHVLAGVFPEAAALLNPPRIATPGDGDTPFVSAWRMGTDFDTSAGPVNRYIHDPSNWAHSQWIVPLGASGHPGSTHYADQQQRWACVETIPQLWDWDDIGREAESQQELSSSAKDDTQNSREYFRPRGR